MVFIPEAVQRMGEEADRIHEQLFGTQNPNPPAEETAPDDPTPTPTEQNTPADPPVPSELELASQRYAALQGKYNSEVPRLIGENRTLASQLTQLQGEVESLKRSATPPAPPTPVVSEEDKATFGDDLMGVVDRVAQARAAELQRELQERDRQLASVHGEVQRLAQKVEGTDFFGALDKVMPDWESTNTDPRFLRWLSEEDPVSGLPRKALLDRHVEAHDASRTLGVFRAFRTTLTPMQAAPQSTPAAPVNPLDSFVAPSRGQGSATPSQASDQQVWTSQSVKRFYDDCRKGHYSAEQAERLEADLMRAVSAGLVT